jgi:hypothetical protein
MTRLWPDGEPVETWVVHPSLTGAVRPSLTENEEEVPQGFYWHGDAHRILDLCNRWRIHTRWWEPRDAVGREYWKVVTDTGLLCLIYRDLLSGGWFLCRVHD